MQTGGCLAPDADPSRLATDTMAMLQGGLLLAEVRRDPLQLHIAVDAARSLLHTASS
jgi:TetR/AcrR family transcriptional repressor of nem operon